MITTKIDTNSSIFSKYELGYLIEALRYREKTIQLENDLFASLDFIDYEIDTINKLKKKCQYIALHIAE